MRQCTLCNRTYGLDITFCLHDGALLGDEQNSEKTIAKTIPLPAPTQAAPTQAAARPSSPLPLHVPIPAPIPRKKKRTALLIILSCVVGAALIIIGMAIAKALTGSSETTQDTPQTYYTPPPSPTPQRSRLLVMDTIFDLGSAENKSLGFSVPTSASNARIVGGYRVTNGGTIDLYLMTEAQYEENGRDIGSNLQWIQGRNSAKLNHSLLSGRHYLIFVGWNSDGRTKTVAAEFYVEYG